MADVAHTSVGFTGTVDQVAEAKRFSGVSAPFRVASSGDWAVTVVGGSNRTVQVAAGSGQAYGARDSTVAAATFASAANSTGSTRLDVLVATFNWATGATSFGIIQGTTSLPTVNTGGSVVAGQINRIPGVQYDAILAVLSVRNGVGAFSTSDVFDCRPYGGMSGAFQVPTGTYRTLLDLPAGAEVTTLDTGIRWRWTGSAYAIAGWEGTDKNKQPMISLTNGTAGNVGNNTLVALANWPTVVDHSGGVMSYTASSGVITCNYAGKIRIDAVAESDSSYAGSSFIYVTFPAGGGTNQLYSEDQAQRSTGYAAAGTLKQTLSSGPVKVLPGDTVQMWVEQTNTAAAVLNYTLFLTVTYV